MCFTFHCTVPLILNLKQKNLCFTSNGHDFVLPRMSLLECTNSCIFPRKTVLFYLEIHTYFHIQTINIEQKGNVYKMYKKNKTSGIV